MTFAISAAFLSVMRPAFSKPVRQRFATELREGWSEFTRQTWIWVSVAHFSLFHLTALACFFVLGPVIAKEELGGSSAYATIMVGAGLGSVVGSLLAMRYKPERQLVVCFLSVAIWPIQLVGYAIAWPVPVITACAFVGAMSMNFGAAFWFTAMQEHIPAHVRSRLGQCSRASRSSRFQASATCAARTLGRRLSGPTP